MSKLGNTKKGAKIEPLLSSKNSLNNDHQTSALSLLYERDFVNFTAL